MTLRIVTPPASDVVTLDEVKAHLRVDFADDDAYLAGLIKAATLTAQMKTQRAFLRTGYEWVLPGWRPQMRIPVAPTKPAGLSSIKYQGWFDQGQQTLAADQYVAQSDGYTVSIFPAYGKVWPIVNGWMPEPVVVAFTSGDVDAAAVPENIKHAVKMLVAHYYINREPILVSDKRAVVLPIPEAIDALLIGEVWS